MRRPRDVALSPWLGGFSIFFFLSLAIVKRYAELDNLRRQKRIPENGRGYRLEDLEQLRSFGTASGYASVVVFTLYINNNPDIMQLYPHFQRLWLLAPVMIFWINRIWLLAHRGELQEDPVVFALTDYWSAILGVVALLVVLICGLGMSQFESWGRYPKTEQKLKQLFWFQDFPLHDELTSSQLPVGMGRSYGDVCLNDGNTLLLTRGLNRLLAFDPNTGILCCESGVTLSEILEFALPHGWFLPVTPWHEIRNRGRRYRQRCPWQEPSRGGNVWQARFAFRSGAQRWSANGVFARPERRLVFRHDRGARSNWPYPVG